MEKIKKIAYKGNEYEVGSSGNNDKLFVDLPTGFILLEKKSNNIGVAYINLYLSGSSIKKSGNFTGFIGTIPFSIGEYDFKLIIRDSYLEVSTGGSYYTQTLTGAGLYQIKG